MNPYINNHSTVTASAQRAPPPPSALEQLQIIARIKELIVVNAQALYGCQAPGHTYSIITSAAPSSALSDNKGKEQGAGLAEGNASASANANNHGPIMITALLIVYTSQFPPTKWTLLANSEPRETVVAAVASLSEMVQIDVGHVVNGLRVGEELEGQHMHGRN